jgi:hypothetical protein
MVKCCGNCQYWFKLKSIVGLCERYDLGWANSDHGKNCQGWDRIRDNKPREKEKYELVQIYD